MEQHPMLNPVVLKHFFGVCQLEDLRRFRLVCPLWRDASLERWREEMIVHVAFDKYFDPRRNSNKRQRLHWKEANILYETPSIASKPFRKYRLCRWQFPDVKPKRDCLFKRGRREILKEFWIHCGPWMKELHLKETKIGSTGTFIQVMTEFAPSVVFLNLGKMFEISLGPIEDMEKAETQLKLKSLELKFSEYNEIGNHPQEEPQITSDTWFGLFATFPNLQELRWKRFYDVDCQNLLLAWSRLVDDGKHVGRKLNIKCHDINGIGELEVTQIVTLGSFFEHPDFTFSHIEIDVKNSAQDGILSRALKTHQNTLKSLKLSCKNCNLNRIIRGPRFLSTAELQLGATPDFHFLKNLPNVERLKIFGYRDCLAEKAPPAEEMECAHLGKLSHLEFYYGWRLSQTMDIFVKCMPNLTVLRCPLSNEIFRVVCQHWRGLKVVGDFVEQVGTLNDEGITGIVAGLGSRLPNITLLKYLRQFETHRCLSDKAVYEGFLQMEHLTDLDIPQDAMSSAAVSALSSKFGAQLFHVYQRNHGTYFPDDSSEDDDDELVEDRMKVQIFAKDYGIILGDESDLYGTVYDE